jgi:hypothetical protein
VAAFRAAHAGEALFKVAAFQELADHLRDHVAQDPVLGLVATGIDLEKLLEVGVDAAPERRGLGCISMPTAFQSEVFWSAFGALVAFAALLGSAAAGTYALLKREGDGGCRAPGQRATIL